MSDTAAPQTPVATPAAPAPAAPRRGRPPKAAASPPAAAKPAAPPVTPGAPLPPKPGEAAVIPTHTPEPPPASDFRPEDTVGGRKKAEDDARAAEEAVKAAGDHIESTRGPTLAEVRAKRRERVEAEAKAKTGAAPAAGAVRNADGTFAAADPAAAEAAKKAAEAATKATGAKPKTEPEKQAEEEEDEEETPTDPAKPAKPAATAEVDIPPDQLKAFTKLNKDLRETTRRVRELEAAAPLADKFKAAQKLAAEGKHFDAIKAVGLDLDAAVKEVMLQGDDVDEDPEHPTDPKIKKLQAELRDATAKLAKLEGTQDQAAADKAKAEAKQAKADRANAEKQIFAEVKEAAAEDGTPTFPYLSKSAKFVTEALDVLDDTTDESGKVIAEGSYSLARKHLGRDLTNSEKINLMRAALEESEANHAARAKLYGVVPRKPKKAPEPPADPAPAAGAAAATPATPTTVDAGMRGGAGTITPRTTRRTLAEIKADRRKANGR